MPDSRAAISGAGPPALVDASREPSKAPLQRNRAANFQRLGQTCPIRPPPALAPANVNLSHPASGFGAIHDMGPLGASRIRQMSTRRMAYWWFRFVVSGRFLEKFFNLRRVRR